MAWSVGLADCFTYLLKPRGPSKGGSPFFCTQGCFQMAVTTGMEKQWGRLSGHGKAALLQDSNPEGWWSRLLAWLCACMWESFCRDVNGRLRWFDVFKAPKRERQGRDECAAGCWVCAVLGVCRPVGLHPSAHPHVRCMFLPERLSAKGRGGVVEGCCVFALLPRGRASICYALVILNLDGCCSSFVSLAGSLYYLLPPTLWPVECGRHRGWVWMDLYCLVVGSSSAATKVLHETNEARARQQHLQPRVPSSCTDVASLCSWTAHDPFLLHCGTTMVAD